MAGALAKIGAGLDNRRCGTAADREDAGIKQMSHDYHSIAARILAAVGGRDNLQQAAHCITGCGCP